MIDGFYYKGKKRKFFPLFGGMFRFLVRKVLVFGAGEGALAIFFQPFIDGIDGRNALVDGDDQHHIPAVFGIERGHGIKGQGPLRFFEGKAHGDKQP